MITGLRRHAAGFAVVLFAFVVWRPAMADDAQVLVDKARVSIEAILADPDLAEMRSLFDEAKGVLVVPERVKAGFFLGGEAGEGVLLARDEATGVWSYPAFYELGSASLGLQFGVQVAETVVLVMNRDALEKLMSNSFTFGADGNIAVATVGKVAKASAGVDYYTFGRSKGLFLGMSIEGMSVQPLGEVNDAYYGAEVSPRDIVLDRRVSNPGAEALRASLGGS